MMGMFGWLAGCGAPEKEQDASNLELLARQPEAREWLSRNGHPAPLASNRFDAAPEAGRFVEQLYSAGATRVVVHDIVDDELEMAQGGPYADALVVRLPDEMEQRARVLGIANREAVREGFEPDRDMGQKTVYLWWD